MMIRRLVQDMKKPVLLAFTLFSATVVCSAAPTTETFQLTACNPPICALGLSSPWATVTKTQIDANTVEFLVTTNDGLDFTNEGFGFNSTLTNLQLVSGSITTSEGTWSFLGPFTPPPPNNYDGFGSFNYSLDTSLNGSTDNNTLTHNFVQFRVSSVSGLTLADVDVNNSSGFMFAVDVSGCTTPGQGACTGFISTGAVPEPTSVVFFATGLLGLGFVVRKRFAARS